jgi:hypothetical protein
VKNYFQNWPHASHGKPVSSKTADRPSKPLDAGLTDPLESRPAAAGARWSSGDFEYFEPMPRDRDIDLIAYPGRAYHRADADLAAELRHRQRDLARRRHTSPVPSRVQRQHAARAAAGGRPDA